MRWIKTSEQLPEPETAVMFIVKLIDGTTDLTYGSYGDGLDGKIRFFSDEYRLYGEETITHWAYKHDVLKEVDDYSTTKIGR